MRVFKLLHKIFKKSSPKLHTKRINALFNACSALMIGKRLTLTGLARSMNGKFKPKSAIRKVDKLLGNPRLYNERTEYYKCLINQLLYSAKKPLISVDWTDVRAHEFYCIRASINIKGRSLVLYEEVHPRKYEKNTEINNKFLENLKEIIPPDVKPIIITDAGFRTPWSKKVKSLDWDYLTRVRSLNSYCDPATGEWQSIYELYKIATDKAVFLGEVLLTKATKLICNLYLYKGKIKGRKQITNSKTTIRRSGSLVQSKAHRDPLLLSTSLKNYTAKQIVNMYQKRMEIEEEFRDLKSPRYGFSLILSGTKSIKRLEILLLIAAITNFICWLISLTLRRKGEHREYQANTVKNTNVLSIQFLACEAFRRWRHKLKIGIREMNISLKTLKVYCAEALNA